jgi:antitoxin PrlF
MPRATLTEKGQIVIPAEIGARYQLTPGTQLEFVHEGGAIRLVVRRRVAPSDPAAGYGDGRR